MENMNKLEIIREKLKVSVWQLENMLRCFAEIPEDGEKIFLKEYCGIPLWKHFYHTIHSLDQWFINPEVYDEPDFQREGLNILDFVTDTKHALSPQKLSEYLKQVEDKLNRYLDGLSDGDLEDCPENCERQRLKLIINQFSHFYTHFGLLMGFLYQETGRWILMVGTAELIPEGEFDRYFK